MLVAAARRRRHGYRHGEVDSIKYICYFLQWHRWVEEVLLDKKAMLPVVCTAIARMVQRDRGRQCRMIVEG